LFRDAPARRFALFDGQLALGLLLASRRAWTSAEASGELESALLLGKFLFAARLAPRQVFSRRGLLSASSFSRRTAPRQVLSRGVPVFGFAL